MTYVPRWASPIGEMTEAVKGRYVLAADAEAHEKAAVEAAVADGYHDCYIEHYPPGIREQAIRDCIAAVDSCWQKDDGDGVWWVQRMNLMATLRALLDEA